MERARQGIAAAALKTVPAALLAAAVLASSCAKPSFGAVLAKIDASPGTAGIGLYEAGARLAASTEDRLRLLKRASRREPTLYASAAKALLGAGSASEAVDLAVFDALLEAGLPGEALGMFGSRLDPDRFPGEYAEALVAAEGAGLGPRPGPGRLSAAWRATGDPRFLVAVAVDAMERGDKGTASMALKAAAAAGFEPDERLLWDAGLFSLIAERLPDYDDPAAVAVAADAAWLDGRVAQASFLWRTMVDKYPYWSWKPYAALARSSGKPEIAAEWPHAPARGSAEALSQPAAMSSYWLDLMLERFPDAAGAKAEVARAAFDEGRAGDFARILDGPGEELAVARAAFGPSARAASAAIELAEGYPDSPRALDMALELLASAGSWPEFERLLAKARAAAAPPRRLWFWEALGAAYRGELDKALAPLETRGPETSDFAAIYDLALIRLASGASAGARDAATIAAGLATTPGEGAAAMVLVGDAELAIGDAAKASAAYGAALGLDPSSRSARSRLERAGGSR